MTAKKIRVSPPNSMIIVSDPEGGRTPENEAYVPGKSIRATESLIVILCLMEQDGKTTVTFGPVSEVDSGRPLIFDAILETPTRTLVVSTVEWKELLRIDLASTHARVVIWTNRPIEPDDVIIRVLDQSAA